MRYYPMDPTKPFYLTARVMHGKTPVEYTVGLHGTLYLVPMTAIPKRHRLVFRTRQDAEQYINVVTRFVPLPSNITIMESSNEF